MYCIRKFADCWAVFNLETERSRPLTEEEVVVTRQVIPSLNDPQVAAFYSDDIEFISDKP